MNHNSRLNEHENGKLKVELDKNKEDKYLSFEESEIIPQFDGESEIKLENA